MLGRNAANLHLLFNMLFPNKVFTNVYVKPIVMLIKNKIHTPVTPDLDINTNSPWRSLSVLLIWRQLAGPQLWWIYWQQAQLHLHYSRLSSCVILKFEWSKPWRGFYICPSSIRGWGICFADLLTLVCPLTFPQLRKSSTKMSVSITAADQKNGFYHRTAALQI